MTEVSVSIAEAKARLSELVNAAEAGDQVVITRRGRPVVTLHAMARPLQRSFDLDWLGGLTATMEMTSDSMPDVRRLRDDARF